MHQVLVVQGLKKHVVVQGLKIHVVQAMLAQHVASELRMHFWP